MSAYFPDRQAEHLLQLSNEVSRIAGTLARLSVEPGAAESLPQEEDSPGKLTQVSPQQVNDLIRARRMRGRFLPEDLFADPAWDMLLGLLRAELLQHRVAVSSLCSSAAVPATTALRWLNTLIERRLCVRRADPHDGRRVFVELTPEASTSLRRYFAALPRL
jgi:DNA-binding MarR family transcriptional regulator